MYFCRIIKVYWDSRRDHMVIGCTTIHLYVQSVPIITNILSLNPAHGEVYSIHLTCDKVCHLLVVGRLFSRGTWVSSTNKTDRHDILLNVALNFMLPLKGILSIHHLKKWILFETCKVDHILSC